MCFDFGLLILFFDFGILILFWKAKDGASSEWTSAEWWKWHSAQMKKVKNSGNQWSDKEWWEALKAKTVQSSDSFLGFFLSILSKARLSATHAEEMEQLKQTHEEEIEKLKKTHAEELQKADEESGEKA